jgi:endonuclease/exonuclease/phosphatase family metal-dependent hydrolase
MIQFSRAKLTALLFVSLCAASHSTSSADDSSLQLALPQPGTIRVATFNASLNRKKHGELSEDLTKGDKQAERIAKIVGCVKPDILMLAEVDYDGGASAKILLEKYLSKSDDDRPLKYFFAAESNTGELSGMDLDNNGKTDDPNDGYGFGIHDGQYSFVVFSRFPIDTENVRSFRKFLWMQMPGALKPRKSDDQPYWPDEVWSKLRLSSKNHVDIPIQLNGKTIHVLASHPTPPAFDGEEDRNGCRNHDEIRLWTDYVAGGKQADYLVSDRGSQGGLGASESFVVVGDLNADPIDGGNKTDAINALLGSPRALQYPAPQSRGGVEAAERQGRANLSQSGNPAEDTGDFNDREPGNLRIDYVIPSSDFTVTASGVFWPLESELQAVDPGLLRASDHRLVWVDIKRP